MADGKENIPHDRHHPHHNHHHGQPASATVRSSKFGLGKPSSSLHGQQKPAELKAHTTGSSSKALQQQQQQQNRPRKQSNSHYINPGINRKKKSPRRHVYHYGQGHLSDYFNRYNQTHDSDLDNKDVDGDKRQSSKSRKISVELPNYGPDLYYGSARGKTRRESSVVDVRDSLDPSNLLPRSRAATSRRLLAIPQRRLRSLSSSDDIPSPKSRRVRRIIPMSARARLTYNRGMQVPDLAEALERVTADLLDKVEQEEQKAAERRAVRALGCYEPWAVKLDPDSIPVGERLTVRRRDSLRVWREQVDQPDEAVPNPALPEWTLLHLDQKIPTVPSPDGLLYFTRGNLGQQLHVKAPTYTVSDALNNQDRVISEPYNSLHDPHLVHHLSKPSVQKLLLHQGLINAKGQVLCSAQQFNKYRCYLRNIYNQSLDDIMKQREKQSRYDFLTTKKIQTYFAKKDLEEAKASLNERRKRVLERQGAISRDLKAHYEAKQKRLADRLTCHIVDKIRQRINATLRSAARSEANKQRLAVLEYSRKTRADRIRITSFAKQVAAEGRIEAWKHHFVETYELYLAERLAQKFEYQKERLERDCAIKETLKELQGAKALTRQLRVEHSRTLIKVRQRHREERADYLLELARKYFYIWLQKVRNSKSLRPDEEHRSTWDITRILTELNREITAQSGILSPGDFLLNLVLLRRKHPAEDDDQDDADDGKADAAADAMVTKTFEEYAKKSIQTEDRSSEISGSVKDMKDVDNKKRSTSSNSNRGSHDTHRASYRVGFTVANVLRRKTPRLSAGGKIVSVGLSSRGKSKYVSRRKNNRYASRAPSRMFATRYQRYISKTSSGKAEPDPRKRSTPLSNRLPDVEHKRKR